MRTGPDWNWSSCRNPGGLSRADVSHAYQPEITLGDDKVNALELEKALADPASVFAEPEDVVVTSGLTDEQKIEILRRWEFNASEESVALEEGMPGEESDMLRRILMALGKLTGRLDVSHTGPAKNHGLPSSAITKRS
jgi:hypothetical protein